MDRVKLSMVMLLWGSIGIFTRYVELSPIVLAFLRASIALPVLFASIAVKNTNHRTSFKNIKPYILSGVLLGFGWTALFYGYKNTSISLAIIIYNMSPIYVMVAAPMVLKERLSKLQIGIIAICFVGLYLIVGNIALDRSQIIGALLSGVSGIIYACIVIINRKIQDKIDNSIATFVQILSAMFVLLPFVLFEGEIGNIVKSDARGIMFICILGVVHTGIAYSLYFSTYHRMKSIEIVSYSYLEPLFGVVLSVIFLKEALTITQVLGGIIILGATYIGEYIKLRKVIQNI